MKSYLEAMHAVQSGVLMELQLDRKKFGAAEFDERAAAGAKSNRTGVNSMMVNHAAIVQLLMDKNIITEAEFFAALQKAANDEAERLEVMLSERIGSQVKLY